MTFNTLHGKIPLILQLQYLNFIARNNNKIKLLLIENQK